MTSTKWTTEQIPDQSGRVAVVTGANTGLGLETSAELAAAGAEVVLAVRNTAKGDAAADEIRRRHRAAKVVVHPLDLADLSSVREASARLRDEYPAIDLLVNNAGVMYTEATTTSDGFEMQFGTNHLGHFAFTGLLLDHVGSTPGSRVVTVSSVGHKIKSKLDLDLDTVNSLDGYDRVAAYGRSKLANLLFTYELQRRLAATSSPTEALAAHPGGSNTELARNSPALIKAMSVVLKPLMQSAAQGALPQLRAAVDPDASGGDYFGPDGFMETRGHPEVVSSSARSHDTELQRRLWDLSIELTGVDPSI